MIPSRYHVVRTYWCHTGSWTPPYVLDVRDGVLRPYFGDADSKAEHDVTTAKRASELTFDRFRRRLLSERTPAQSVRLAARLADRNADLWGVCAMFDKSDLSMNRLMTEVTVGGASTLALSSAYVAGTSGSAVAARHLLGVNRTINALYFFISSYTGTAASVTDINVEVRPEASAGSTGPNTSVLTDSATVNPSSATGWVKATGLTAPLSALGRYFYIVGDANGNATNFATVQFRSAFGDAGISIQQQARWLPCTTTNGWPTPATSGTTYAQLVANFADGTSFGDPLSTATSPASSAHQRGLYIDSTALPVGLPLYGVVLPSTNSFLSGMKIFTGSTAPNGTAANTSTDILYATGGTKIGSLVSGGTPYTLSSGTTCRIVFNFSGANTGVPNRMDIGAGADANLRAAMPGDGLLYWTEDDGASSWANDLNTSMPAMGLLLDGWAASSSGSVLPRIIHQPGWAYYEG